MSITAIPGFSEPFSSMSHLFATGPFFVWGIFLLVKSARRPGKGLRAWWLSQFIVSTLFLLSMSGVYHLLEPGHTPRIVLQRLDHAAIFVLIAGTFTAAHGILFKGVWRWGMISTIWALATTAIALKTVFFREVTDEMGLVLYLGLGWMGLISGYKMIRSYGVRSIRWLLLGAFAYSFGAMGEFIGWPVLWPGVIEAHEFFHIAVLLGLFSHWYFIWELADGAIAIRQHQPDWVVLDDGDIEDRIRSAVPAASGFDFNVEHSDHQTVVLRLKFNPLMLRVGGTISGPTQMALADTAMYALLFAALGNTMSAVTSDLTFHFLAKPIAGDLVAKANFLRLGGRLAVIDVHIHDFNDVLVTQATGTYVLPPAAKQSEVE